MNAENQQRPWKNVTLENTYQRQKRKVVEHYTPVWTRPPVQMSTRPVFNELALSLQDTRCNW